MIIMRGSSSFTCFCTPTEREIFCLVSLCLLQSSTPLLLYVYTRENSHYKRIKMPWECFGRPFCIFKNSYHPHYAIYHALLLLLFFPLRSFAFWRLLFEALKAIYRGGDLLLSREMYCRVYCVGDSTSKQISLSKGKSRWTATITHQTGRQQHRVANQMTQSGMLKYTVPLKVTDETEAIGQTHDWLSFLSPGSGQLCRILNYVCVCVCASVARPTRKFSINR